MHILVFEYNVITGLSYRLIKDQGQRIRNFKNNHSKIKKSINHKKTFYHQTRKK